MAARLNTVQIIDRVRVLRPTLPGCKVGANIVKLVKLAKSCRKRFMSDTLSDHARRQTTEFMTHAAILADDLGAVLKTAVSPHWPHDDTEFYLVFDGHHCVRLV